MSSASMLFLYIKRLPGQQFLPCLLAVPAIVIAFAAVVGAQETGQPTSAGQNSASASAPASVSDEAVNSLLVTQEGHLPILLSAPHGGQMAIPGADARQGKGLETGPSGYRTVRDVNTDRLALALSAALEAKTGKKPYLVVAKFARKYADVNRPANIAYEDAHAKPVYEAYHQTLTRFCEEIQRTWGKGLLIDIHGQGVKRDTVFRGTHDGKTVSLLRERYGEKAHNGPGSLAGILAAKGVKVFPTDDKPEQNGFTGGYIVTNYGSRKYGMDAIQLEFGGDYTDKNKRQDTAAKLADALLEFSRRYLPDKSVTTGARGAK